MCRACRGSGARVPRVAAGLTPDHLKCYKIRDSLARQAYDVQMTDQFGGDRCTVGRAGAATESFVCYKARCRHFAPETLVQDQFGRRIVRFSGGRLVCAPANGPSVTTTTTVSTTSTTAPPCGSTTEPQCDGVCPGFGEICQSGPSGCHCQPITCGTSIGAFPIGCYGLCPPETRICASTSSNLVCAGGAAAGAACTNDADCPGGSCQQEQVCGQCVAGTTPCGDTTAPACDGVCPPGQVCGAPNGQGSCHCLDYNCSDASQGGSQPAPMCWGFCPPEAPICRDVGGSCLCRAS